MESNTVVIHPQKKQYKRKVVSSPRHYVHRRDWKMKYLWSLKMKKWHKDKSSLQVHWYGIRMAPRQLLTNRVKNTTKCSINGLHLVKRHFFGGFILVPIIIIFLDFLSSKKSAISYYAERHVCGEFVEHLKEFLLQNYSFDTNNLYWASFRLTL